MKLSNRLLRFSLSIAGLMALTACGRAEPSYETSAAVQEPVDSFEVADNVSESELSEMRGGFEAPGGLNINFGLETTNRVNGMIVSSLNISGKNLNSNVSQQALQQIIQVGTNNSFSTSTANTVNKSIITIIQNTTNNVTIQNTNQLSLNVSNLASFRNQAAFLNSFGPLIRSLH